MIKMSRDKFFHRGNAHTSTSLCVAVSQSKRVEMGQKGIEMS